MPAGHKKETCLGVMELGKEKQADKLQWELVRAAPASSPQGLSLTEMLHIKQDFTVNEEVACVFVEVLSSVTSDLPLDELALAGFLLIKKGKGQKKE